MRRERAVLRRAALGVAFGLIAGLGGAAPATAAGAAPRCDALAHHVAVVVEHGDGGVVRVCAGFTAGTATAREVLDAAAVEYGLGQSYGGLGGELCQVDHEPASYAQQCLTAGQPWWQLQTAPDGGAWSTAAAGIDGTRLHDGDALGLLFYPRQAGPLPPPAGICTASSPIGLSPGASPPGATAPVAVPTGASAGAPTAGPGSPSTTPGGVISSTPTPVTSQPSAASPAPAVAASLSPTPVALSVRPAGTNTPPDSSPGLLAAAILGGGLVGLLVLRLRPLRRRR